MYCSTKDKYYSNLNQKYSIIYLNPRIFVVMYSIMYIESVKTVRNERKLLSIALYRYENHEVVDQLISVLNPEAAISKACEERIGFSNKRLQQAPKFYEIAKRVLELVEKTIVVCFDQEDFRLLQEEFETLGFPFSMDFFDIKSTLQQYDFLKESETLSEVCKMLGIPFTEAFSNQLNGLALVKLFKIIQEKDIEKLLYQKKEIFSTGNNTLFKMQRDLPHTTGVFYMHNAKGDIIYLECTNNIHIRVNQLLTEHHTLSDTIRNHVDYITYDATGSELIALLKEELERKRIEPVLNETSSIEIPTQTLFDTEKSFLIVDKGRVVGENSFVLIKNGAIAGYGYYDLNHQINCLEKVEKMITPIEETKRIRYGIHTFIKQKKYIEIIDL